MTTVQAVPIPVTEHLESFFKAIQGFVDPQINHVSSALESKIQTPNLPLTAPTEVQMLDRGVDVLAQKKTHRKTTSIAERELELEILLGQLNAREAESKATTGRGVATISEVNEMWKKRIDEVDTPFKAKSVAFGPEVTTHDSSSLLKLENDLELVQLNAIESAQEATAGRKQHTIDEVNEIWKLKTSEDVNPLRANKLTFSPSSE